MPIDASIYSNIQPVKMDIPSPLDSAQRSMSLSALGMQQATMARQFQTQQAVRDAYSRNTGADGNLNQQAFLSDLAKVNPQAAMEHQQQFAQMAKQQAEARAAQADAAQKTLTVTGPAFDHMASLSEDQRAAAYPQIIQQLKDQGVDVSKMDHPYDPTLFRQYYGNWKQSEPALKNMLTKSEIGKNVSEANLAPVKLQSELYGSRSPNAELTSQYDKQAQPIRSSQIAMKQMMDNYNNPSPQGDASLILNAFKIKFPTAPDVNSLEELSKSQAATDTWKNMAHKALQGGLDQNTRDNLMRDGVSTYRANVDSLAGIQKRYQARAQVQNVNDPSLTYEPAVKETYNDAMALQKKIGPYVPPTDRGGILSSISRAASKVMGAGGDQNVNAAAPKIRQGTVEDGFVYMGGDPGNPKSWKRAK